MGTQRIAVVGGRVQYSKNGLFLRESAAVPVYPLVLDATLGSAGASVRDGGGLFQLRDLHELLRDERPPE